MPSVAKIMEMRAEPSLSAAKIIQILLHYPDSASKNLIVYEKR